ncbi:MAG: response regulator transcription factor [Thermogemmatispora sp.]|uniref:response regulator transcription factor n=1 Tax=Thermogemmatispora sp. TaxID=1968838 RepID=UPI001A0EF7A6|nr:response regulator transcription factor [Thermogemmatispora sp.]MBE3567630.1 response regulator transcription factor [Thermogemmatispora sp.]
MMAQIRVLLAEGQLIYRAGVRYLLERDGLIEVLGEAGTAEEAFRLTRELRPEVLILDLQLPHLSGLDVIKTLRRQQETLRVLALSRYDDETYLTRVVTSGVDGCLLKAEDPMLVVEAVHALAAHDEQWWSAGVSKRLLNRNAIRALARSPLNLSRRELQILQLMALGYSNRHIAATLCLSTGTVKNYVSGIYGKLQVRTRAGAVSWVWQRGLLEDRGTAECLEHLKRLESGA